jgi:crotonobetainyl-CoA:carnitine CoA-transferase CaiB-like acyl-CoA transferase
MVLGRIPPKPIDRFCMNKSRARAIALRALLFSKQKAQRIAEERRVSIRDATIRAERRREAEEQARIETAKVTAGAVMAPHEAFNAKHQAHIMALVEKHAKEEIAGKHEEARKTLAIIQRDAGLILGEEREGEEGHPFVMHLIVATQTNWDKVKKYFQKGSKKN